MQCGVQDLLQPKSMDLQLRESPEEGVYVAGLNEVLVTRLEDCLELLKLGERNRRVSAFFSIRDCLFESARCAFHLLEVQHAGVPDSSSRLDVFTNS
jgi:Kinesin motor domain